ncbi:hypothetical protein E1267_11930 [Nonomuraea longispora]|uniref:Uncharacterized protein n=1 Tax=Nonomuraea longispora TaxID=1848320 RepID=A0A4R4NHD1_9ACTN|nr:hypothetical protein [Nonomuraea longispora]TDC07924.1 hypothetical protein E1267_11930 [Nonomuraea longispora]
MTDGPGPTTAHAAYARRVVQALVEHFDELTDAMTSDIVEKSITASLFHPFDGWEVILDSPYVANWKLKPDTGNRIRVACIRTPPRTPDPVQTQRDLDRERALTRLLQELAS